MNCRIRQHILDTNKEDKIKLGKKYELRKIEMYYRRNKIEFWKEIKKKQSKIRMKFR